MVKRSFVKQLPNKPKEKQEKCPKWLKNHVGNQFYVSPNKSTVVD